MSVPRDAQPHDSQPLDSQGLGIPANRVCPRAVAYWRTVAAAVTVLTTVALGAVWAGSQNTLFAVATVAALVLGTIATVVVPPFRYRVHRWEATDIAVHTRTGWLNLTTRIAPLSRVQTVELSQNLLMRFFQLASLQVTTASAAGAVTIEGLDAEEARELVGHLTAVTGADHGDAT